MRYTLAVAVALALLFTAPRPAAAEGDGAKVLKAFLDVAAKAGPDARADCRFVGRLADSVLNARARVEYKDPGLLRLELERPGGRVIAVLDLNRGEGFYVVPEAATVVRFRSNRPPWNLAPGDMRRRLEGHLGGERLEAVTERGQPLLAAARGDGSRLFSLAFTPGYKSVSRYTRHRPDGGVSFFIQFRDVAFGTIDAARFTPPKGVASVDLPAEATNPFDYLEPAEE